MQKVIILKGLPASGKSTYALKLVADSPGQYKRINKDELRQMLDGGVWSKDNEKFVIDLRDDLIMKALLDGKSVIVDDTNLHPKHEINIRNIVEEYNYKIDGAKGFRLELDAIVEVKSFDTDVNECIRRDSKRANGVGAEVIRKMYNQFIKTIPSKVEYNPSLPNAIICDMDGTLALHNGRSPYETEKCETDLLNEPVVEIVRTYFGKEVRVIIVSGREDMYRQLTANWLFGNDIPFDDIHMRNSEDKREDSIVKKELYEAHIKGRYNILFVLDDRRRVVDMWRNEGLTVLQVDAGDF